MLLGELDRLGPGCRGWMSKYGYWPSPVVCTAGFPRVSGRWAALMWESLVGWIGCGRKNFEMEDRCEGVWQLAMSYTEKQAPEQWRVNRHGILDVMAPSELSRHITTRRPQLHLPRKTETSSRSLGSKPRTATHRRRTMVEYDIPDRYLNLSEVASSSPVENPRERGLYRHHTIEDTRREERDYRRYSRGEEEAAARARACVLPQEGRDLGPEDGHGHGGRGEGFFAGLAARLRAAWRRVWTAVRGLARGRPGGV